MGCKKQIVTRSLMFWSVKYRVITPPPEVILTSPILTKEERTPTVNVSDKLSSDKYTTASVYIIQDDQYRTPDNLGTMTYTMWHK